MLLQTRLQRQQLQVMRNQMTSRQSDGEIPIQKKTCLYWLADECQRDHSHGQYLHSVKPCLYGSRCQRQQRCGFTHNQSVEERKRAEEQAKMNYQLKMKERLTANK